MKKFILFFMFVNTLFMNTLSAEVEYCNEANGDCFISISCPAGQYWEIYNESEYTSVQQFGNLPYPYNEWSFCQPSISLSIYIKRVNHCPENTTNSTWCQFTDYKKEAHCVACNQNDTPFPEEENNSTYSEPWRADSLQAAEHFQECSDNNGTIESAKITCVDYERCKISTCTQPNTSFPDPANNEYELFRWKADDNKSQLCTDTYKGTIQSQRTNCEEEYRCIIKTDMCRVSTKKESVSSYISPAGNVFHEDIPIAGSALNLHYSSNALDANMSTHIAYGWSIDDHALLMNDKLYLGNRSVWSVEPITQEDNTTLVKLGSKEFLFDIEGKHTQTRDIYTKHILQSFSYDSNALLESITDRFGNITTLIRDDNGVLTSIRAPLGQSTTITIDDNKDITHIAYEDSSSYNFIYEDHLMTSEQEPKGNTFTHIFDTEGKIEKVIDAEQGEWLFANTASSDANSYSIQRASGDEVTYKEYFLDEGILKTEEYLPWGETTTYANALDESNASVTTCGTTTLRAYKMSGSTLYRDPITNKKMLASLKQSMPSTLTKTTTFDRSYEYNGTALLKKIETATINEAATFTTTRDYANATQTTLSAEGIKSIEHFDVNNDLLLSFQYGNLEPTYYTYDERGRLLSITQGNRVTTHTYDDRGNIATLTDAKGKITTYTYDTMDRLTTITYPDSHSTHFSYDSNGNMTMLTTPTPSEHTFAYNGVNKRTGYTSPLQKATEYIYDKQRRLIQIIKPSTKSIETTYTNGRITSLVTPEDTYSYTYACGNNLASVTKGSESIHYTYDGELLTSLAYSGILNQTLTLGYDNTFNITSFSYAGDTTNYLYNKDNALIQSGNFTLTRNTNNGLVTKIADEEYTQERNYNKYGELTKLSDGLFDYKLTRDTTKITRKQETISEYVELFKKIKWLKPLKLKKIKSLTNYRYVYDKRDRLTKVYKNGRVVEKYTYDSNGNRASATINGITTTGSYTLDDQLEVYGNNTYRYDDDGYLEEKVTPEGTTTYTYGTLGELREVVTPTHTITYEHNANNQRTAKLIDGVIVEKYLWSDLTTLLAIYDKDDTLIQRYEYTDQRVPTSMTYNSTKYYLHYDQVGSLRAISDTSGNIIKEITYDTYGNILTDTHPTFKVPFGFAGGLLDKDTGLTRFGYRDYDAYTGKWSAKDPIDFNGGDTNLYGYVLGDPVGFVDADGLDVAIDNPLPVAGLILLTSGYGYYLMYDYLAHDGTLTIPSYWWDIPITDNPDDVYCEAKGGKQNIDNEYTRDVRNQDIKDPCKYLRGLYNSTKNNLERQKIKKAQKRFGCDGKNRF